MGAHEDFHLNFITVDHLNSLCIYLFSDHPPPVTLRAANNDALAEDLSGTAQWYSVT